MSAATVPEVALSSEVREFLKQHNGEAAFAKVCALVRECYPHLLEMTFRLRDDPDVEERDWCVIDIKVPLNESEDQRLARWQHYHERLVEEIPVVFLPLFTLGDTYV